MVYQPYDPAAAMRAAAIAQQHKTTFGAAYEDAEEGGENPEQRAFIEEDEEEERFMKLTRTYVGRGFGSAFTQGSRVQVNCVSILVNVLAPWVFFCLLFGCRAGSIRWHDPLEAITIFVLLTLIVMGKLIADSLDNSRIHASWIRVATLNCLIAVPVAWICGTLVDHQYLFPYHLFKEMRSYKNFDVTKISGKNVQDMGIVEFAHGTRIDETRSWQFKKKYLYCVAPIVRFDGSGKVIKPVTGSTDFFAVGKDCCSPRGGQFNCGEMWRQGSRGGLRVVSTGMEKYFAQAVKAGEMEFSYLSNFPIFVEWSDDPVSRVMEWRKKGMKYYALYCMLMLCFYTFSVLVALFCFAQMGRGRRVF